MTASDGPAALLRIADLLFTINQDGAWSDAVDLASQWEAERAQAAANRDALAQMQHANDAERSEWSEYYALLTGDRGAWSPDDMRRAVKAQTDALAQARALLVRHAVRYGALGLECEQCGMTLPGHASGCLVAEVLGGAR